MLTSIWLPLRSKLFRHNPPRPSRQRLPYEDEATTPDDRGQAIIHSSTVCASCKVHHEHMSHVQTWKSVQTGKLVTQKGIIPENLICRPCWDDVHRMVGNPDYIVCA